MQPTHQRHEGRLVAAAQSHELVRVAGETVLGCPGPGNAGEAHRHAPSALGPSHPAIPTADDTARQ